MRKILLSLIIVTLLLIGTQASAGTALAGGPAYHVVQPGQTLFGIASQHGVSSWALAYANGLWNPNWIYSGQVLVIPHDGYGGYGHHYYNPGFNPCAGPYGGHAGCSVHTYVNYTSYTPHRTYGRYYVVCWGDTLSSIAWKYGLSPWTIANANGIYNLNWIYAGQRLYIPG